MGGLNLYNATEVENMAKDFRETSLEYNEGYIDGLLWVLNSGNKTGLNEIISMVEDIRKANDEKLSDEEKQYEQIKMYFKTK